MKKRNLFLTLGLALGLGVGVAAGLGARGLEAKEVEAATTISSVTLKSDFDSWGAGVAFTKQSNGDWTLSYALTTGDFFKILVQGGGDQWVGYSWGIDASNIEYEFVGDAENNGNFKALSSHTLNFTVKSTFYTNYGSDVTIKLGETRTVQFTDESNNVFAGTDNLVAESNQYTGLITTNVANAKFRIKDTIGETVTYHGTLEAGVTAAVVDGDFIKVASEGTYAVYYKKASHDCWVTAAEEDQEAYAYAAYFLSNIGCDEDGILAPSGWTTCATRYGKLSNDAKDFIYEAEDHWTLNDALYNMIQTYNWALNHNPNRASMSHFIVDHSGNARDIPAGTLNFAPTVETSNITPVVIILVTTISLVAVGSIFVIRRRKENN